MPAWYWRTKVNERNELERESIAFSSLDANTSYWKIEKKVASSSVVAFISIQRLLRYTWRILVLNNDFRTFHGGRNVFLYVSKRQHSPTYLSGVVVILWSPATHIYRLTPRLKSIVDISNFSCSTWTLNSHLYRSTNFYAISWDRCIQHLYIYIGHRIHQSTSWVSKWE